MLYPCFIISNKHNSQNKGELCVILIVQYKLIKSKMHDLGFSHGRCAYSRLVKLTDFLAKALSLDPPNAEG